MAPWLSSLLSWDCRGECWRWTKPHTCNSSALPLPPCMYSVICWRALVSTYWGLQILKAVNSLMNLLAWFHILNQHSTYQAETKSPKCHPPNEAFHYPQTKSHYLGSPALWDIKWNHLHSPTKSSLQLLVNYSLRLHTKMKLRPVQLGNPPTFA